ncbi:rhodanese-like domain-containing protein [Proteiniclasticum ruminis]|uniref:Rhodanese-related sulfurtransferase n=1 Tax=Proteiniclasticum ruminis TaxID=398199 RepID=A0A1I5B8W7_9CLOT|nr:rhodanese-like domain-containing protein [Proteiniclasticum ruminis]SFN70969.1 Rhodanese-related sulfurtransferase [Proteiniclasticum ruminis]
MLKKLIAILSLAVVLTGCAATAAPKEEAKTDDQLIAEGWVKNPEEAGYAKVEELPAPRTAEGDYSIDNSAISSENLVEYLGRNDVVYIDLRDYNDYAKKHFKNFEAVPFFAYIWNENAHTDASMVQLYGGPQDAPVAVYESSEAILNTLFPKDKTLFLMCQSGGRVAMMMKILEANGYDMSKVYNVGGMAQYTDGKYREFITDTPEFIIDVTYKIEGATRN